MGDRTTGAWIDLFWLPLGAGGHFVRWNGRVYEWLLAHREHRSPANLFHTGLTLSLDDTVYAVEMGPVWNVSDADRGVVCEGPVGSRWLGRLRAFRYEVRCWPGGYIPDAAEAVDSPVRITEEPTRVAALLEVLRDVPALTWGRDELGAGEMWNSNSVVAWALARTGHNMDSIMEPAGGRAPGWRAGLLLAHRQVSVGRRTGLRRLPRRVDTSALRQVRSFEETRQRIASIRREAGNDVTAWPPTRVVRLPTAARSNPARWQRVA